MKYYAIVKGRSIVTQAHYGSEKCPLIYRYKKNAEKDLSRGESVREITITIKPVKKAKVKK